MRGVSETIDETPCNAIPTKPVKSSSLYAFYVVGLLSLTMAFSLIDRFALSLLFEPIKTDLGLSDTELGLLHGLAFGLFYAGIGIPLGHLVDVWSRKWVIFWGVAVWSLATASCGFARNFPQLLLARIGVGVGEAALSPAGYSIITDIVEKRWLATAISVFQMGSLIGAGLAFLAGGAIYTAIDAMVPLDHVWLGGFAAWQLTFIVLSLPGVLFLLLTGLLREPQRKGLSQFKPSPAAEQEPGVFAYLWASRGLYGSLMFGCACVVAVSYGIISWCSTVLAREFGWSLSEIGLKVGLVMLICAPLGVLLGGLLADRWSRRFPQDGLARVLVLAAGLTLPFLLAMPFVRSGSGLFALIVVIQFTSSLVIGVGPTAIQLVAAPFIRGRASAVYVFVVNALGLGLGPISVGLLSDHVFQGDKALLYSLATYCVVMCISAVLLLLQFRKHYSKN
ncbi:MFS transporter [Govanella unica]|uniref:MFS transporter n=1 Tax=Govanella unica TaxID=2975056 RepID=A0A9X3U090_9PROT|nr:MFS transporter [Govania unica]MDA5195014.1 MFS transporter [Govania unica]